jgi:hypothetical protein
VAAVAAPLPSHLSFLAREVPAWERENHCFSCHNNGDGARALFFARRKGFAVAPDASTIAWLRRPRGWDAVKSTAGSNDKNLARIQFASALAEGWRAGVIRDAAELGSAAELLATTQDASGSWPVDAGSLPGAPATWGTPLATYMARDVLVAVRFSGDTIARADRWLADARPANVVDAAALLLANPARRDCRDFLLAAQSRDGGWGPQRGMPAEPFDTAIAVLALRGKGEAARRGRVWLLHNQDSSGAWPETTRPSGGTSYAERISTAAWVTIALLSTQ